MLKSPLRYLGGKSRAVKTIVKLLPDFDKFREPFLGGGSVFVYVKQRFPNKKYWTNDLCAKLYQKNEYKLTECMNKKININIKINKNE
ncbi:MAG: DNA adenine methylase [Prevotellaceae bacterium]|jgi:DNA adenine methylase|nr:DNA adenine methylase [Prevotellaceae bacterium]